MTAVAELKTFGTPSDYLDELDNQNPEAVTLLDYLPERYRGELWVRLLAHFVSSESSSIDHDGINHDEALEIVHALVAPNGVSVCEFSGVPYWLPISSSTQRPIDPSLREELSAIERFGVELRQERGQAWYHRSHTLAIYVVRVIGGWSGDSEIAFNCVGDCDKCSNCLEWSDDIRTMTDTREDWCESCREDHCYFDEDAGAWYEDQDNIPRRISDRLEDHELYGYNREASEFFGHSETGTFYGFELEIEEAEAGNDYDAHLEALPRNGLWLFHFDGSLDNGLELVTNPMSGDYIREQLDLRPLDKFREAGWRSWDTTTCGLHVHVSRAGFAGDVHLFAFAQFVYRNRAQMIKLAGRNSQQYASFNEDNRPALALDVKKKSDYANRYVAVNFQPMRTVECRFFRGSLNPARVRSALELVSGIVEFTRPLTIRNLNEGALEWSNFVEYLKQTPDYFPNLLNLIERKGL